MIDTPLNCLTRASVSRSEAEGPMLENVRRKHLASAAAWEGLASVLQKNRRTAEAPRISRSIAGYAPAEAFQRPSAEHDGWENEGGSHFESGEGAGKRPAQR